ncbi:MAG: hypothetical protein ABW167_05155 [Baekduia sp.]
MDDDVRELLADPEYREAVAENAYMRERVEDAAVAREHDTSDSTYHVMAWESLSDDSKRPYRTAVAEAFECVASIAA